MNVAKTVGSNMVTKMIRTLALSGLAVMMGSCVPPKAVVVAGPPVVKKEDKPAELPVPDLPPLPDEDIRLPQMLNLPTDGQFRASNPDLPKVGSSGVIVRPPTDPPSRVKPGDKVPE